MNFCNANGMAHSKFLQWDPDDRAKALAFEIEKALRCQMCGTAQWEWDADRFAYEAVHHHCPGCYIQESVAKEQDDQPGVTVQLAPTKDDAAKARHARAAAIESRRDRDRE